MPKNTFNTDPYFDDFDETKNFHKILFKPKFPVQTRELNQSQSIINNQIERFGNHIFKHGSMVADSTTSYNNKMDYVRLKDLANTEESEAVDTGLLIGKRLVGKTTGITADVILSTEVTENDPPTVYIKYLTSSEDGLNKVFLDGEELTVYDNNNNAVYSVSVRCPTCQGSVEPITETTKPTGKSSVFSVTEGTWYVFGHFVHIPDQIIILDKYDTVPSTEVGFNIIQSLITEHDDLSLLDNSLGYPNYTSPGADRYKIQLNLENIPLGTADQDNWVMLARIEYGVLKEIIDKPQYADLMDTMARRTYDESGDYTVKPFLISFMNFLKSSEESNDGLYYPTLDNTQAEIEAYENKYVATMTGGKAYVKGYEIERLSSFNLIMERARDTGLIENNALRYTQGNYIYVALTPTSTAYPLYSVTESEFAVDFEDVKLYNDLSVWETGAPATSFLGTCKVKSQLNTGKTIRDHSDTFDVPVMKLYLFDMDVQTGKTFSEMTGIYKAGITTFSAKILSDNEYTEIDAGVDNGSGLLDSKIYEPQSNSMITKLSESYTSGIANVDITTRKKFYGQTNASGEFIFSMAPDDIVEAFNPLKWIFSEQQASGQFVYKTITVDKVNVSPDSKTVTVSGFSSNKNACVILDVITYNVASKIKTITTASVNIELTPATFDSLLSLGIVDAYKILSVTDVTDPANETDVTGDFILHEGTTDNIYGTSYIQRPSSVQPIYGGGSVADYVVVFEYFTHNNANNGYFFSANSYNAMVVDPNQDFDYEDIPVYIGQNEESYKLSSCLDFRVDEDPQAVNGQFTDTTFIPSNESNVIHDITFYLPRVDKIVIDSKTKNFIVVKGIPSVKPIPPKTPKGTMELYTVNMEPYTLDIKKDVLTKYKNNRRYTMRDIGKLEKRLDNLEYYVTFNMLERDASEASIKDANGIDRYKNGFITDNFESFKASDTKHPEFNGAIDIAKSEMRPSFHTRKVDIDLDLAGCSNYQITGNMVTQEYSEVSFQNQPTASKTMSVNPYFIFNWVGAVRLVPDSDSWKDVTRKPDLVVGIDTGMEDGTEFDDGAINGVLFGNWQTRNTDLADDDLDDLQSLASGENFSDTGTFKDVSSSGLHVGSNGEAVNTLTITKISDVVENKSLGDRVTDVNLIPFVRAQDIQFVATGMRPNTVVYPFFDDVPVAQYCRQLNGANGGQLMTTADGEVLGVFSLPNTDVVNFHTGDRVFKLSDSIDNSDDEDVVTTSASTKFWSGGLTTEVQNVTLAITTEVQTETQIEVVSNGCVMGGIAYPNGTVRNWNRCVDGQWEEIPRPPPPPPAPIQRAWSGDPIAQTFTVNEENGCFLTKIDMFFSDKPETEHVWVEIRETINGYPGPAVLPYSHTIKQPANVNITDNASKPTTFVFESPVYVKAGIEYCFVIGSNDMTYRIHVARLGGIDHSGAMIISQPSLGSLFKSQNNTTWNAEQTDDVKFNLYKADFNRNPMTLNFKDSGYDVDVLGFNPIETEINSDLVRIHHKQHGFVVDDTFTMDLFTKTPFDVVILSGNLIVGQEITHHGGTGRCVVTSSTFIENMTSPSGAPAKRYVIKVKDIEGYFDEGEANYFQANQYFEEIADSFVLDKMDINRDSISATVQGLSSCVGYFEEALNGTISGIPFEAFTDPVAPLRVVTVDSIDSYTIQTSGFNANLTANAGGDGVTVGGHIQMDMFNLSGDFKKFDCTFENKLEGVSHAGTNSIFVDKQAISNIDFNDNEDELLEQPMKISNQSNVGNTPNGYSLNIDMVASTLVGNRDVSPVVMMPTIGFTTITNRVDWNDQAHYEVAPNYDNLWDTENPVPENARWVDETDYVNGVESAKYVLKKVTLANPATTIKIYADVFKPNNSAVDFYYKILPVEKSSGLENEDWVKAPYDTEFVSSSANDFIEAEVTVGDPDYGQTPLLDFKEFRIKAVLRTKNSAIVPKVKNLRAIAVT